MKGQLKKLAGTIQKLHIPVQYESKSTVLSVEQARRKDDNSKELDTVIKENDTKPNHDTPSTDTVQLKEAEPQNTDFSEEVARLFQDTDSKRIDFLR